MEIEANPNIHSGFSMSHQLEQLMNDIELLMKCLVSWNVNHDSYDEEIIASEIVSTNNEINALQSDYPKIYNTAAVKSILHFYNDTLFPNTPSLLELANTNIGELASALEGLDSEGLLFSSNGLYGSLTGLDNILKTQ